MSSNSGQAEGGQAEGGQAEGGQAEGGQAEGGQAEGGQAEGGQAEGGQAEGGQAEAKDAMAEDAENSNLVETSQKTRAMTEGEIREFNRENIKKIPNSSRGIYTVYSDPEKSLPEPIYVGRSVNIKTRLQSHIRGGKNSSKVIKEAMASNERLLLSYGLADNEKGAEAAEIERLSPSGNKRKETSHLEDFQVENPSSDSSENNESQIENATHPEITQEHRQHILSLLRGIPSDYDISKAESEKENEFRKG